MSQQSVELVARLMDAFHQRDIDAMVAATTPDLEWFPVFAARVEGDVYRGRPGIEAFLGELEQIWEEFVPLPEEYIDHVDRILALGRLRTRGRGSGVPVDSPWGCVYELDGGRVSRIRTFLDHDEATRAVDIGGRGQSGSRQSVEILRTLIGLWNARERRPGAIGEYCDAGVELESPLASVAGVPYVGHAGIERWALDVDEQFSEWSLDVEEIRAVGDAVLCIAGIHGLGRASGIVVEFPAAIVTDFGSDHLITRIRIYRDLKEALEALGPQA